MRKVLEQFIVFLGKNKFRRFTGLPIYIGGCGRSGTTLLLAILAAHRDIYAFPKELRPFKRSGITNGKVYTPKFFRLYRALIFRKIKKTAVRYCEKSPVNIRYIREMEHYHGDSFRFIHIVRDGRDVILSRHPKRHKEYWISPERWIKDVQAGMEFEDHPCVYTLRYEDLISDFDKTVSGICSFLGLSFSDEIRNWHSHTSIKKYPAIFGSISELYSTSVGKWKDPENTGRVSLLTSEKEALEILRHFRYLEEYPSV